MRNDMRPMDLIVAINGRVAISVDDLHRLIVDFQDQPLLTLSLVCGTRTTRVDVRPAISVRARPFDTLHHRNDYVG